MLTYLHLTRCLLVFPAAPPDVAFWPIGILACLYTTGLLELGLELLRIKSPCLGLHPARDFRYVGIIHCQYSMRIR